jgi:predicted DNA-binding transcriptional regulator AlpA
MNLGHQTSIPWETIPATGPLLRPKAAAAYLGISVSRFYGLAAEGLVPRPIRIGRGSNGASGVPVRWLDALIGDCATRGEIA